MWRLTHALNATWRSGSSVNFETLRAYSGKCWQAVASIRSAVKYEHSEPFLQRSKLALSTSTRGASARQGDSEFQSECDVLVIGGGGVGASTAYWLKKRASKDLNVVVVERDSTYKAASTVLSVGGVRQQFSLPENIRMSLFGADFIQNAAQHLGDVDMNFQPHGYLMLASYKCPEALEQNSKLQNELGAKNELLTPAGLKEKFPWLNTEGIALGCYGLRNEGWFDPWALLMGYRSKAKEFGAHFINGNISSFEFQSTPAATTSLDTAVVQLSDGERRPIKFSSCVLAAGACSAEVARLADIGTGAGALSVPLPVEPRKRFVYVFTTQGENAPGLGTPLTIDPDGTYFRRDGMGCNYICGRSPDAEAEPSINNLDVDHEFFDSDVWPRLATRVPAFESVKVCGSWAGYYEYNTFDENGIIGRHTHYKNLYIATGFSGHGIQQTPAVGRAISELIIDGRFKSIDLTRLGFERLAEKRKMCETYIV